MLHARVPRRLAPLGLAALLVPSLACTKSGEAEGEAASAATPAAVEGKPAEPTQEAIEPKAAEPGKGGLAEAVTEGVAEAVAAGDGRLERGDALAHVVVPNASRLLEEIRTQAAPPRSGAFLDETSLRSLARMALGPRAGLADHLVLDQPMGCVLVDDPGTDVPVACAIGYTGGAAAAAADLGSDGKQPDAAGHVAHYRVADTDLYLDDLAGHVVVSNHPAVLAKAQGYLVSSVIGRAPELTDDVEMVAYPKAAMARYSQQVEQLLAVTRGATPPPGADTMELAITEYSRTSLDRTLGYYRELDQVTMGMGLEPIGLVMRYALVPTAGSSAQSDAQAIASGPVDLALAQQLPEETWLLSASTVDWKAAWGLESVGTIRDLALEAYANAVGRDAATVRTGVEAFLDDNARLYADDTAAAVVHLPGTQGGLVVSRKLLAPGRESWRAWTAAFDPAMVLGPEASKEITWSFTPDAMEVDGVAVDRWTLELGPAGKAKVAAEADPAVVAEIERRLGGLKIEIDRVELADRVLFVLAPGAQERYIRAAIQATRGGPSTGSDPGLRALLTRHPAPSVLMGVDVGGALAWAREVLPAEATRSLPTTMGVNLGDFCMAATYGTSGRQHGELVLSQAMIDELRKL